MPRCHFSKLSFSALIKPNPNAKLFWRFCVFSEYLFESTKSIFRGIHYQSDCCIRLSVSSDAFLFCLQIKKINVSTLLLTKTALTIKASKYILPKEIVFCVKKFLPKPCSEDFMERHGKVDLCRHIKYVMIAVDHAHNVRGRRVHETTKASLKTGHTRGCQ